MLGSWGLRFEVGKLGVEGCELRVERLGRCYTISKLSC